MGLYKRQGKEGATWNIQYFAHGKRIREAIGPSKRQAELVLAKRKAEIREGRFFDTRKESTLTLPALIDRYLAEYAAVHKKPRSYERNLCSARVLKGFFGDILLRDVKPERIDDFLRHRQEQGKAPATINGELALLGHMFTWAQKKKLTSRHPVRGISKFKTKPKERYLDHEEIGRLLEACTGDLHAMVTVALGTGMRASEVLGLDRDHVNLAQRTAILTDTKNGERRVVSLPLSVVELLRQRPLPIRELFPGWTLDRLVYHFSMAAKRAGLTDVTFHTLRHTFASHAAMQGADLYTLAGLLGHKTLAMVQRYAHLAPAHLQSATDRAAEAIFAEDVPQEVPHETKQLA